MAVICIIHPALADREAYESLISRIDLDHKHPAGLIMHSAGEIDGTWQVVNVWDSEEYADRFDREVLEPAMREITGGSRREVTTYRLHHLVTP
jgi:hypothetical protein